MHASTLAYQIEMATGNEQNYNIPACHSQNGTDETIAAIIWIHHEYAWHLVKLVQVIYQKIYWMYRFSDVA